MRPQLRGSPSFHVSRFIARSRERRKLVADQFAAVERLNVGQGLAEAAAPDTSASPHGRDFFRPLDRVALADESLDHLAIIELQRSYSQRRRDSYHKATKIF